MITYKMVKAWQEQLDNARDILSSSEQEVGSTLSTLSDEMSGALLDLVTEADPTAPFDMLKFATDAAFKIGGKPLGVLT